MKANAKQIILKAILLLAKPIVRLGLRNGVTFREFTDLCRRAYVEVASDDYGLGGRSTNISRIAMMTGINRKDIKRVKDAISSSESTTVSSSPDRIARIIAGWHQDRHFTDKNKTPIKLPFEGSISFTELVKRFGGDVAAITLLKEFKRSGVVTEASDGLLSIVRRNYIPNPNIDPEKSPDLIDHNAIVHASSILNDHINTIFHNLYREETGLAQRFERRATNHRIRKQAIPEFRALVEDLGQDFLENIDNWLSEHEADDNASKNDYVRLGTGTYWIEGETPTLEEIVV